ncbi:tyrosine-type recombinase/integrase [Geoalkalibacter halelectricus]|uniref:tyrosine-type recombinase/integrase n=1 Tax=Geoalkalibacter halelectricus TaxID=2847045 RepID=UPI002670103A|nr:tyrosine-type recombinase/integrase [Geoalkalibacter halelectricus]MDO3380438.1 site-specific integrase [Geoalkalibacter halelectricus]
MSDALTPVVEPALPSALLTTSDALALVADWIGLDVANGDARQDTIKTYQAHFAAYLAWCEDNGVLPGRATTENVKQYRQALQDAGAQASTIKLKLTTVRRFYQSAVDRGLMEKNPAKEVRAPRERRATQESIKYLSAGEAEILFRAVPVDSGLKGLRDRALIALMALEGLRRVEVVRACIEDIEDTDRGMRILVRGKGKDRFIYPREDTAQALKDWLSLRGCIEPDESGIPLFVEVRKGGKVAGRLTRSGLNRIIDTYLAGAGLKRKGLSCHALRHTCGTLLYQATRDIKVVQETLGHQNISTSAGYAHVVDRGAARHTQAIPVKIIK